MRFHFICVLLITCFVFSEATEREFRDRSGDCGDDVHWTFIESTSTLFVSGTGEMNNFSYPSEAPWSAFRDTILAIVIEGGVKTIGENAFYRCSELASVSVPGTVNTIATKAFYGCKNLTSFCMEDGVVSIEEAVFEGCSSLKNIAIPSTVTSIGRYAFRE